VRLEHLEVAGFGRLDDANIVFHPRVTVIVGDNESGKSTLQRAVRAALYGIDAGGQGRAVERSDWMRWKPWMLARYGIALTYALDDGRRVRVSRRLDTREQSTQVQEIGGGDVTDLLRCGRVVVPGRFHLGVEEPVFCATAWLGDDGLRLGAPEAPPQRAEQLQEAMERLADTGRGVTAAEAIALLRLAVERVGSERRLGSPLGAATTRIRELDGRLADARARLGAVAHEQERLVELEVRAQEAARRQLASECRWLTGRLADLGQRRGQLDAAFQEAAEHAAVIAATQPYADFRIADEERVISLGAQLNQATMAAAEARAHWEASAEPRRAVARRRAEIASGIRALGDAPADAAEMYGQVRQLHAELAEVAGSAARLDTSAVVEERRAALRREIAATGYGKLPAQTLEQLGLMLERAPRRRLPWWVVPAAVVPLIAAVAGILLATSHRLTAAAGALVVAVAAVMLALGVRRALVSSSRSRDDSAGPAPLDGLTRAEIDRLGARLPSLRALQAALLREEALAESRRLDAETVDTEAAALLIRCEELARRMGLAVGASPPRAHTGAQLERSRELLSRIDSAIGARMRRAELAVEDERLGLQEAGMQRLDDEMQRADAAVEDLDARLQRILVSAGMSVRRTPTEAVAAFREACAARRGHDEALRALEQVRRRIGAFGVDDTAARQLAEHYAGELRARGGDPDAAVTATPLDAAALQELESDVERARREAASAGSEADALRARLSALYDSLPSVADLEDERSACVAVRERALSQLAALQRSIELIEEATRGTHRELAPQLAASVQRRLGMLTDSRYTRVNVDTDHFEVSLVCSDRPDFVPLELVSHGTRDQVSLLLRLALCETLSSCGESVPLMLDEPLLTSDPQRRQLFLEFLHHLSETNQVLLTTTDPSIASAMQHTAGDDCAIITLDGEPTIEAAGRRVSRVRVV